MATINTTKNAVELRTELQSDGTTIEYITINDQTIGILGSLNEADREAALKTLNDTYNASNGNIYEMMQKLMTIAIINEKSIEPDEQITINGIDFMFSYSNAKAYTMDGEEIANCDDVPNLPKNAIKALLTARIEAIIK